MTAEIFSFPADAAHIAESLELTNVIFTNGCFDILHPGHLSVISRCVRRAREIDGVVVIGVDDDASVALRKGPARPVFPAWHRSNLLGSMYGVYKVIQFPTEKLGELICLIRPRLVVKGGDYTVESAVSCGYPVEIVETLPGWSTTGVIESLL